jgi:hypothetical protein
MKDKMEDINTESYKIDRKFAKITYNKPNMFFIIDTDDKILHEKYVDMAEIVVNDIKESRKDQRRKIQEDKKRKGKK